MDVTAIAVIASSSLAVSGAIMGGFWKLANSIGRLEGKVEGMDKRMEGCEDRIGEMTTRLDGVFQCSEGEVQK